jgi:hypothetical protein
MKSGIAIVDLWEKLRKKTDVNEADRELLIEVIETGLKEAYEEGQRDGSKEKRKK